MYESSYSGQKVKLQSLEIVGRVSQFIVLA